MRIFQTILRAFLLFLTLAIPSTDYAASIEVDIDNVRYTIDDVAMTAEVYGPSSTVAIIDNLIIPDKIEYNGTQIPVTSIREDSFRNSKNLESVVIGNSVISIGTDAFSCCRGLNSVIIGNSVTSIDSWAFYDCSGLTKAEFASIESLCKISFAHSTANPLYYAHNLWIAGKKVKDIVIPNCVTSIGQYSFDGCSGLTSLEIPNSVTSIGQSAFEGCSGVTSLKIPGSVTSIGQSAFEGCSGLTSLKIPSSVTSIGGEAFEGCRGLKEVTIADGESHLYFGAFVFADVKLTKLYLGRNFTHIGLLEGQGAPFLSQKSLKELTIGNSVTSIDSYAFSDCSGLTSLKIPNSVTSIGRGAFRGCSGLTSLKIPNSVTLIGSYAFSGCKGLTSVTIPNSVTSIDSYAFYYCSSLNSVTIPNSVTSIGTDAFSGCRGLKQVTIADGESALDFGTYAFAGVELTKLYLGRNFTYSYSDLQEDKYWSQGAPFYSKKFLTELTFGNAVTSIVSGAFKGCSGLTSLEMPNSVTTIGQHAFYGCSGLTSLEIPNSVTSIGENAFYGCRGLINLKLSNSLTEIKENTFYGCISLTSLNIPDPVQKIGSSAFYNCNALKTLILPGSLREISYDAFSGCPSLESVKVINPIPPVIENTTFSNVANTNLTVPDGSRNIYKIHPYWGSFKNVGVWGGDGDVTFVADNVTYRVTSEADRTVEITAVNLTARKAELEIPSKVKINGQAYRVAGISNNGFENVSVASVSLPATIGYVGLEAFNGCRALRMIDCKAVTPPSVYDNSFDEATYSTASLNVPEESINAYKQNDVWGKFNIASLDILVECIELNPNTWEGPEGESFDIVAAIYPANASNQELQWTSSDEDIATVDAEGHVNVLKAGSCQITVSATDGSFVTAVCTITATCTSGLDDVIAESTGPIAVYNINGILIMETTDMERLRSLAPAVYILRQGSSVKKIMVK